MTKYISDGASSTCHSPGQEKQTEDQGLKSGQHGQAVEQGERGMS